MRSQPQLRNDKYIMMNQNIIGVVVKRSIIMEAFNGMMGKCGGLSVEAIWRKNELNHNLNSDKKYIELPLLVFCWKKFLGRAKIIDHCFYNNAHFVRIIISIFSTENSREGQQSFWW